MPFPPRPVDSTLHGVVDYMAGATLTTVMPKLAGVEGTRSARQIRTAGATHATYSTMTNYPLGIVKRSRSRPTSPSTPSARSRSAPPPSSPASTSRAGDSGFLTSLSAPSS